MFLVNFFRSSFSLEINHYLAAYDQVREHLPNDLIPIVLNYKGPNHTDLQIGAIAVHILDQVNWDRSRLSARKNRYLEILHKVEIPELSLTRESADKKTQIASQLFRIQKLIIGEIDKDYEYRRNYRKLNPALLCDSIAAQMKLKKLHICDCRLTDEHIDKIIKSCSEIDDLKLSRSRSISDQTLQKLGALKQLKRLHLSGDSQHFTGKGLPRCPQLTSLYFGRDHSRRNQILTEFPLEELIKTNPQIEELHIDGFYIPARKVCLLEQLPRLRSCYIGDYSRDENLRNAMETIKQNRPNIEWKYGSFFIYGEFD